MKNRVWLVVLVLGQLFSTSCTTTGITIQPEGDRAEITFVDDSKITAELLAVENSVLYLNILSDGESVGIKQNESLIGVNLKDIESLTIKGYANNSWILPWTAFQVIPPIILGITAANYGANSIDAGFIVWGVTSIPALISGISLKNTSKGAPVISANGNDLKKYVRYPLGINDGQLNALAQYYGQKEYRILAIEHK